MKNYSFKCHVYAVRDFVPVLAHNRWQRDYQRTLLFYISTLYELYLEGGAIVDLDRIGAGPPEGIVLNLSGVNQHLVTALVLAVLTGDYPLSGFVHMEKVRIYRDVVDLPHERLRGAVQFGGKFDKS